MHLIHIEDSEIDGELVAEFIHDEWPHCEITRVASREEFEATIQNTRVDVIVSDYTIPGYDALSALALAQRLCPGAPFIFFSGTIGEERAIEALKAGATDYVLKDRPARIIPAIRNALAVADQQAFRRRTEEALREQQERLQEQASLLDKASDAIFVTNMARRVTYWNVSAERIYGWKVADAMGRDLRELLYEKDAGAFDEARAAVSAGGAWQGELHPSNRAGEPLTVKSSWSLVRDEAGNPASILSIDTDVTERRKLEIQLLRSQRMESVGMLAGGIAHDLNNMLAPIIISLDLLRERLTSTEDIELIDTLGTSAEHGAELVRQILAFARGAEGQRTPLQPRHLIESVVKLLQQTLPRSIEVRFNFASAPWMVSADATQLKQVLLNLCINARDAMPKGGLLEIRLANVEVDAAEARGFGTEAQAGPYLRISVTDTGSGIPPEMMERIFDPFFTTKAAGKGTGLGLSTVAGIVRSHEGFVEVESALGIGTTFHIYLPGSGEAGARVMTPTPRNLPLGRGESILLIDDDDGVRTVLEMVLSARGYRVSTSASGERGLEEFARHRAEIDLVITDLMMPGLSGAEVVQRLRAVAPLTKIIAFSGLRTSDETFDPAVLVGVEVLDKPITAETLLKTIRQVLDAR